MQDKRNGVYKSEKRKKEQFHLQLKARKTYVWSQMDQSNTEVYNEFYMGSGYAQKSQPLAQNGQNG